MIDLVALFMIEEKRAGDYLVSNLRLIVSTPSSPISDGQKAKGAIGFDDGVLKPPELS